MNQNKRKKQIELDTAWVITNRIFDVVIMFLSIFTVIYFCNHQFNVSLIMLIADVIIILINNGFQAFRYLKRKFNEFKVKI